MTTEQGCSPLDDERCAPGGGDAHDFLSGGGEMGARMRAMDWSSTPLGPVETWPQSLRTATSICLTSFYPMFIWWGTEWISLYNDACRPMLGAARHPQWLGRPARECWAGDWSAVGSLVEQVFATGITACSPDLLLAVDREGRPKEAYFTLSYSPIWDEQGGIGGVFVTCQETTERVRGAELERMRQEAMREIEILLHENREQRELLQALFEHAADAIVVTDPQGPGRVLAANPAAQRMFGYSADEFGGLERAAMFSPGEQNLAPLLRERDAAGRARAELRYRRKDGSEFPGEMTTALFTTGDGTRNAVAIIRDVTERRQMEQALQESEQKYRELVQYAPAGIYEVDFRTRRFTAINDAMCEISGYSRQELLDMDPLELLDQEGQALFQERLACWLQRQEPERSVEYRIKTRDGRTIDAILNVTFTADQEGNPLGARVVAHDITGRKRAEQGRQEANERYELVLAGAQAAIWDWDVRGKKVVFSPRWKTMRGFAEHEINDDEQEWSARIHPEDVARVMAAVQAHFEGRTPVFNEEYRVRRKDGSWMWIADRGLAQRDADGRVVRMAGSETDISERKQAEKALAESERTLRMVLENSQDAINMLDLATGQYLFMSPAQVRLTGFSEEEILGITAEEAYERVHPDDREISVEQQRRIAAGEEAVISAEYRWKVKSGEYRWFSDRRKLVFDEQGRPVALVGVSQDITERKQAEEALRRYAERLRFLHEVDEAILAARSMAEVAQAVVDRAPRLLPCRRASAVLYDPQTRTTSLLAAYQDSGHGEPGQVWEGAADVPWDEVLERLLRTQSALQKAEGQAYEVADVQALPASSPRVALLQAEGVRSLIYEPIVVHGQFVGALKLGLDVPGPLDGEQREVVHELAVQLAIGLEQARLYEEVQRYAGNLERLVRQRTMALRASEARFRTIFEEAAIGIALAEPEGRLVATNPALQQMLGYSEQELARIRFFDLLAGRNGDDQELPPEVLTGRYDDYTQELQYVRKDGETGQANVTVSLLREEEDEPSLLLALVEDVSERKRAQDMLIQTERLAIMGRMAASLAHEVNNPIQSVVGCLGLATEVLAEGEDASEYLTVAMEELERAARIVHQMRDLGRQEEGIKEPGNVGDLVDRALLLTRKRAQNQGIEVTWKGAARLPPVPMVSDRIQQVFLNLVLNAIDAMPQGGKLHVRAVRTKGPRGVAISFADTGMGIPAKDVARLFDAFHSTKQLGLGLGLFVSRNIVQEHGGRIDVESKEGRGTMFTVWLPG